MGRRRGRRNKKRRRKVEGRRGQKKMEMGSNQSYLVSNFMIECRY